MPSQALSRRFQLKRASEAGCFPPTKFVGAINSMAPRRARVAVSSRLSRKPRAAPEQAVTTSPPLSCTASTRFIGRGRLPEYVYGVDEGVGVGHRIRRSGTFGGVEATVSIADEDHPVGRARRPTIELAFPITCIN
ncbi:hypothetical protein GUJ93_ZPchr0006g42768 [Zizania palustris]|uniref:Uncharacterized protein n=1 Tax=Zizania palustris TaxID=103762 RepID=A0A8J5TGL7_ZIZPA|nr:hypothetical protein GUJ93_ZPchr0006g42768 [Zizania palustris]